MEEKVISVADALETLKLSLWPNEIHRYNAELAIRELAQLGGRRGLMATSLRLPEIVEALRNKGNTDATINRKVSFFRKLLVGALKAGYIAWLPDAPRLVETVKVQPVLSAEQADCLIEEMANRYPQYAGLVCFLLDTGALISEAARLDWTDITHQRITFWNSDRTRPRSIALTRRAYDSVRLRKIVSGGPFHQVQVRKFRKSLREAAANCELSELNVTPTTLRYTCEARLLEGGIDTLTIQKWFGYRTPRTAVRHELPDFDDALRVLEPSH